MLWNEYWANSLFEDETDDDNEFLRSDISDYGDTEAETPIFAVGDKVMLYTPAMSSSRHKRASKLVRAWKGPLSLTEKLGTDRYTLLMPDGRFLPNIHANRLKIFNE
ncbi:hypothetical protein BGW37DRAFT_468926 [Umbelopsis sp. PMI_123]|nr:hypothetical protein BGW37DRAFT_468926 [Umbelopsis sp. PMI_123]